MPESLKTWLIRVGLQKMGPSAIRAAIAGFAGLLIAKAGLLEQYGVVYDQATHVLSLHLDKLQAWLTVSGLGLITAIFAATQHHAVATVEGKPQDGSHARVTDLPLKEGEKPQ